MLRDTFPNFHFAEPATEAMLEEAERLLGVSIPEKVRKLYQECNGFREDKGHAQYLFPLFGSSSLVELTPFLWENFEGLWPDFSLKGYIFFGSSCADHFFGVNSRTPFDLIQYHHHMENEWETHGGDVIEMFASDYHRYDDADAV